MYSLSEVGTPGLREGKLNQVWLEVVGEVRGHGTFLVMEVYWQPSFVVRELKVYRFVFSHKMACFLGTLLSKQESHPSFVGFMETCRGSVAPTESGGGVTEHGTHVLPRAKRAEENSTQHKPAKQTRLLGDSTSWHLAHGGERQEKESQGT